MAGCPVFRSTAKSMGALVATRIGPFDPRALWVHIISLQWKVSISLLFVTSGMEANINTSRYRTIADRLLGLRLVPARLLTTKSVSYEFMNRQMVWHAFTVRIKTLSRNLFQPLILIYSYRNSSSSSFPSSTPAYFANASSGYSRSLDSYPSFHLPFVRFSPQPRAPTIPKAKERHPLRSKSEANTGRTLKTPVLYAQRTHHCNSVIPRADFRCNISHLVIPACRPTPFIRRMWHPATIPTATYVSPSA